MHGFPVEEVVDVGDGDDEVGLGGGMGLGLGLGEDVGAVGDGIVDWGGELGEDVLEGGFGG